MHFLEETAGDPVTGRSLGRRRLLAYAAATLAGAGAVGAVSPDEARALISLGETSNGVTSIQDALRVSQQSAWGGQTNGRISSSLMATVPASVAGSGFLRADAARQYFALAGAFQSATGRALAITEGYRSYDRQVEYWNRYQAGTGNLAAYPGTSNHGWGISCDFGANVNVAGSVQKRWMDANAPTYGWSPTGNTFSKPEPWHFDYVAAYQPESAQVANSTGLIALRVPEAMPGVGTSYTCLLGLRFLRHFTTIEQVNAVRSIGVPYVDVVARSHFEAIVDLFSIPRSAVVTNADYWRP